MKLMQCLPKLWFVYVGSVLVLPLVSEAADRAMVSWNNLGMHCMDSDYSVFSLLPPYNTIQAQLMIQGRRVTNAAGYTVTYQAVADPDGSFNSTALGKGNFYEYVQPLYGAKLAMDAGLAGYSMPGTNNLAQALGFDPAYSWFIAEGIPLTPYDDGLRKNPYPLMRLVAYDATQRPLATNDIVLPVSDEMDCRACHASGSAPEARPENGWVWTENPERDYRLNILRFHDDRRFAAFPEIYGAILSQNGFNPQGLYRTVVADGRPVLCAKCHRSNALPGTGFAGLTPLTTAVHSLHAYVVDPDLGLALDNVAHRAACYRCHPGSTTRCLRGAMGRAVAADGSPAMQCQSCHGRMSQVGAPNREGWLNEPNCQSCHTGTATRNNGQLRNTSVFNANGTVRPAVDPAYATQTNVPAAGLSLYRFSSGHGGLQCAGCHGSTHAEFPSSHRNDNLRSQQMQGHVGLLSECAACHPTSPNTAKGGPHGLHPVGQAWISQHDNAAGSLGRAWCASCHGADYRGTVLSRSQADRTLSTEFGNKVFWRGFQIGCYTCHQGPSNEQGNPNQPAVVSNITTNTTNDRAVALNLPASDANNNLLTLRIVSQPEHGSVALTNRLATYYPEAGYVGTATFTFAAGDGSTDSNLGTGTVAVAQGPYSLGLQTRIPDSFPAGWGVPFSVTPKATNISSAVAYLWDFNDGTPTSTNQSTTHVFRQPGTYRWQVVATVSAAASSATTTNLGTLLVTAPMTLEAAQSNDLWLLSWTQPEGDVLLEWTAALGSASQWIAETNTAILRGNEMTVAVPNPGGARFYRLRKL